MAFLTGLLLMLIGSYKIVFAVFSGREASVYSPAVLITIGGMLILAVRRK